MTLFALTFSSSLLLLGETTFTFYVLCSFVAVAKCTLRKQAAGRLVNGRAAPMSLSIPPAGGWLFAYNVLALVFAQSALYLLAMLTALMIFWAVCRRRGRDKNIVPRAGAWLFIVNVIALLWLQSPLYMVLIVMGQAVLLLENRRTAQEQFGLDRLTGAQLVKWSILICGAVIVVIAPVMQLFQLTFDALHLAHPEQESVEVFRQVKGASRIIDFLIQAVLIAPIIEELFFRGFLLTYLKTHLTTWAAILLSAAIFALAHQNLDSVLPLWVLGIVLGVAYEHTGSILLPMGIHACFNLTTGLTLLAQKVSS
jgi:membrane protease YdiL (CAAX protease family)